jgi:uncharacterized protein (DUF58 family)
VISPRTSLILLAAAVVLPAATLVSLVPAAAQVSVAVIAFALMIAALDAIMRRPLQLSIILPPIVRLSKDRPGVIEMRCRYDAKHGSNARIGIPFPPEIGVEANAVDVAFQTAGAQAITIPCQPVRRGHFLVRECYVRYPSRLRLWNFRRAQPVACEVRVYPDLRSEQRHLAALFLRRGGIGLRPYRQVGKGREFEKLREYLPGDSIDDIHWKATAKRSAPVTKEFQVEQTQEVYALVDASRLSGRLNGGVVALERSIKAALILCLAAGRQNDLFGLVTFSDRVHSFVRAKNGAAHYNVCRDAIYTLQPEMVSPDFEELFTSLALHLRRRSLLLFLTALDDPALGDAFAEHISTLSRRHVVLVQTIRPAAAAPLFATGEVTDLQEIYARLAGHLLWKGLRDLQLRLRREAVELSLLSSERLAVEAVTQYLRVKQQQRI